jgi:hypothetical protein
MREAQIYNINPVSGWNKKNGSNKKGCRACVEFIEAGISYL